MIHRCAGTAQSGGICSTCTGWRAVLRCSYLCHVLYQLAFSKFTMRSSRGEWHVGEELLVPLIYLPEPRSDALVSRR